MEYSPILSYATAGLELSLVAYVLKYRKEKTPATWSLLAILVLLAGYQIFEALNCSPLFSGQFSRAAFVDITWLPPVGLLYIALVMRRKAYSVISAAYLFAGAAFSFWYILFDQSVLLSHCDTVMAVYTSPQPGRLMYGLFYQSGIALLVLIPLLDTKAREASGYGQSLTLFSLGVLGFVVPSVITAVFFVGTQGTLPSVMCHYALVLGVCIGIALIREMRLEHSEETSTGKSSAVLGSS